MKFHFYDVGFSFLKPYLKNFTRFIFIHILLPANLKITKTVVPIHSTSVSHFFVHMQNVLLKYIFAFIKK